MLSHWLDGFSSALQSNGARLVEKLETGRVSLLPFELTFRSLLSHVTRTWNRASVLQKLEHIVWESQILWHYRVQQSVPDELLAASLTGNLGPLEDIHA